MECGEWNVVCGEWSGVWGEWSGLCGEWSGAFDVCVVMPGLYIVYYVL